MFSYYNSWIANFSDKILILSENNTFPLPPHVLLAFNNLKSELETSVLVTVNQNLPLTVESDASDEAISATLNQGGGATSCLFLKDFDCKREASLIC